MSSDLELQLLFFFSALGAFNGLLLSVYFLFFAKPKHLSNRFLGLLLLMISIRVGKSIAYYFNPELSSLFLQIGLTACFFIGPFLYFYIKSITYPGSIKNKAWIGHILILTPLILFVDFLFPFKNNYGLWQNFIDIIYLQWLGYIVVTGGVLRKCFKKIFNADKKLKEIEIWALNLYVGNTCIWISYVTFPRSYYIVSALSFSFLFYWFVLLLFYRNKKTSILPKVTEKYAHKKIDHDEAQLLVARFGHLLNENKLYKNPHLKLSDIASSLGISSHRLSQLLNDNMGQSFPSLINGYRVSEAENLLKQKKYLKLEAIGYECGFNSKSAFYKAFKKHLKITPAQYQKSITL